MLFIEVGRVNFLDHMKPYQKEKYININMDNYNIQIELAEAYFQQSSWKLTLQVEIVIFQIFVLVCTYRNVNENCNILF